MNCNCIDSTNIGYLFLNIGYLLRNSPPTNHAACRVEANFFSVRRSHGCSSIVKIFFILSATATRRLFSTASATSEKFRRQQQQLQLPVRQVQLVTPLEQQRQLQRPVLQLELLKCRPQLQLQQPLQCPAQVTGVGAKVICIAIKMNLALKLLSLSRNALPDDSKRALYDAWSQREVEEGQDRSGM